MIIIVVWKIYFIALYIYHMHVDWENRMWPWGLPDVIESLSVTLWNGECPGIQGKRVGNKRQYDSFVFDSHCLMRLIYSQTCPSAIESIWFIQMNVSINRNNQNTYINIIILMKQTHIISISFASHRWSPAWSTGKRPHPYANAHTNKYNTFIKFGIDFMFTILLYNIIIILFMIEQMMYTARIICLYIY